MREGCELPHPARSDGLDEGGVGLPASTTHFADTGVSTGSAVSTGVDESRGDSFAHQNQKSLVLHETF